MFGDNPAEAMNLSLVPRQGFLAISRWSAAFSRRTTGWVDNNFPHPESGCLAALTSIDEPFFESDLHGESTTYFIGRLGGFSGALTAFFTVPRFVMGGTSALSSQGTQTATAHQGQGSLKMRCNCQL